MTTEETFSTFMDPNAEDYELLLPEQQGKALGQEDQLPKSESRQADQTAMYFALVFTTITWVIVLVNDPVAVGWFALHPLLQSLSLFLFTYGIITLQPTSQPKTKAAGLVRHQYAMLGVAFPLIFVGTFSVWYNKSVEGKKHFYTWHGRFGIGAMAWIVVQILLGGGSVWFGGAAFGGGSKAKALWKYHRLSGYILFALLFCTAHLGGAWSNWGMKFSPLVIRIIAFAIAPIACLAGVYARVRTSKMKFT
ncbi:hypothetical protein C8J57DRAFT_1286589 [Mycena rebaudengoi]|nr:hypothetical protein C8J57DRAFT_1286589 [Mycena rebaudengoi]